MTQNVTKGNDPSVFPVLAQEQARDFPKQKKKKHNHEKIIIVDSNNNLNIISSVEYFLKNFRSKVKCPTLKATFKYGKHPCIITI